MYRKIGLILKGVTVMIEILKTMFEANPKKSTIVLNGKCSDCGCETIIEITATPEGFRLLGGALIKCSHYGFITKCSACYRANHKINNNQKW